jgi:hypothetical protein
MVQPSRVRVHGRIEREIKVVDLEWDLTELKLGADGGGEKKNQSACRSWRVGFFVDSMGVDSASCGRRQQKRRKEKNKKS